VTDQTVPDSGGPETFIPETLGQKIFDAARQVYEQWRTTPNRDAYVGVHIERAARAAVDAVALDLMAAGRAQAAADLRAYAANYPEGGIAAAAMNHAARPRRGVSVTSETSARCLDKENDE
jgi:TolA-binding protein